MADEQTFSLKVTRPQMAEIIDKMTFSKILHLDDAARVIWEFDLAVAQALSTELGATVTSQRAGRSSGNGHYITITFRIDSVRKEARGMENYIQLYTTDTPEIHIRLFSYEEGHRDRRPGGAPIPVVDVGYDEKEVENFDVKAEVEKVFIDPYTHQLAEWEKQRLKQLTGELREFCNKRNILGFSVDNLDRRSDN
ncbi:MAG: hypothetical protein IKA48_01120 [Fibrobacter sp.]|nr:hypothetical protein [Fibrobacter sp.]